MSSSARVCHSLEVASAPEIDRIVRDARWLAHRYEPQRDSIHFRQVSRETHRQVIFLTDEYLPPDPDRIVALPEVTGRMAPPAPIHFLFHSAFCCSTLLARAFDIEGKSMGLKEPVILNDLSGWRYQQPEGARVARTLDASLALLARPFEPGETIVVKPSNVVNPLAQACLQMRPTANALLLYAPLPVFLTSVAKKGMWGRLWVRELLGKLLREGWTRPLGFDPEDHLGHTDLQVAAVCWLAQQRHFAGLVRVFGDSRVRTLDSETLLARPVEVLSALAQHYGIELEEGEAARIAKGPAFSQNSKTREAYDGARRDEEYAAAGSAHAEEIEKVGIWAQEVARSAAVAMTPGAALLG